MVRRIVRSIRIAFVDSKVIEEGARQLWLEKIDNMKFKVGYPDKISDDGEALAVHARKLAEDGETWSSIVVHMRKFRNTQNFTRAGEEVDKVRSCNPFIDSMLYTT